MPEAEGKQPRGLLASQPDRKGHPLPERSEAPQVRRRALGWGRFDGPHSGLWPGLCRGRCLLTGGEAFWKVQR